MMVRFALLLQMGALATPGAGCAELGMHVASPARGDADAACLLQLMVEDISRNAAAMMTETVTGTATGTVTGTTSVTGTTAVTETITGTVTGTTSVTGTVTGTTATATGTTTTSATMTATTTTRPYIQNIGSEPGHQFMLAAVPFPQSLAALGKSAMYDVCNSQTGDDLGFYNLGRGVERPSVWLAVKQYIYSMYRPMINSTGPPSGTPLLIMPMYHNGSHWLTVERGGEQVVTLPPNIIGNQCGAGDDFCGGVHPNGWDDYCAMGNGSCPLPDPEGWNVSDYPSDHWPQYLMCIQEIAVGVIDTISDPGHKWYTAITLFPSYESVNLAAGMRAACANAGVRYPGRGVERANSWLVAKKALYYTSVMPAWATEHGNYSDGGPWAAMCMAYADGTLKTIESDHDRPVVLPTNIEGDSCDQGENYCGYQNRDGWDVNDLSYPDPEGWNENETPATYYPKYLICQQELPIIITDTVTDPGRTWKLAATLFRGRTMRSNGKQGMLDVCSDIGLPWVGRGVERVESWLVAKRYLWDIGLIQSLGSLNATTFAAMPLYKNNGVVTTIEPGKEEPALLPANLLGSNCNETDDFYCGYFYSNGWATDDDSYPDPSSFASWDGNEDTQYMLCIQEETTTTTTTFTFTSGTLTTLTPTTATATTASVTHTTATTASVTDTTATTATLTPTSLTPTTATATTASVTDTTATTATLTPTSITPTTATATTASVTDTTATVTGTHTTLTVETTSKTGTTYTYPPKVTTTTVTTSTATTVTATHTTYIRTTETSTTVTTTTATSSTTTTTSVTRTTRTRITETSATSTTGTSTTPTSTTQSRTFTEKVTLTTTTETTTTLTTSTKTRYPKPTTTSTLSTVTTSTVTTFTTTAVTTTTTSSPLCVCGPHGKAMNILARSGTCIDNQYTGFILRGQPASCDRMSRYCNDPAYREDLLAACPATCCAYSFVHPEEPSGGTAGPPRRQ